MSGYVARLELQKRSFSKKRQKHHCDMKNCFRHETSKPRQTTTMRPFVSTFFSSKLRGSAQVCSLEARCFCGMVSPVHPMPSPLD